MRTRALALVLIAALLLNGCALFGPMQEVAESPTTFAVCKAADVATTAVALNSGHFHEVNPLLKGLIGPHNIMPLVAFSIGVYLLLRYINEPKVTLAANAITCPIAAHNAVLLMK